MVQEGATLMSTPEIMARMRVYAGVVRASGENLAVLERAHGNNPWEGQTWVR